MTHSKELQAVFDYIENHLCEALSVEHIADIAGFSKYYFHRTFQKEVGIPLYDYIRRRRLAKASFLLITTDCPILDLALAFQFESQEAFTRAFKRVYQLPPGKYRSTLKNLTIGEKTMPSESSMKGWLITGTAPEKYRIYLDSAVYNTGTRCACIASDTEIVQQEDFATVMQQFNAQNYLGKRMRLSGFIRTKDVTGWCGLWMRVDGAGEACLKFDNMQSRAIKGTTEWNHYACVLDIPQNGELINIGMLLAGEGQAWLDNVRFQEVDLNTPTTDFHAAAVFQNAPENCSFEE